MWTVPVSRPSISLLTLADLCMVYSSPECTMSFSEAPYNQSDIHQTSPHTDKDYKMTATQPHISSSILTEILSWNSRDGMMGIDSRFPPPNFLSRDCWTLSVKAQDIHQLSHINKVTQRPTTCTMLEDLTPTCKLLYLTLTNHS